ncbi:TPA: RHS repeat-associated core domain-containing protein [Bacillus cereus]|nr:RHS repeat-associated core domain-containing protein [Bacillus cereus]
MEKNVSGQVTRYFYDGDSINPLYETDGSGTVLRQYVYSTSGTRLAMKSKGQTLYYHYNPRGDVVAMTDQNREVVATYEYDAWGNVLKSDAKGIAADNPFGYAGYMYDKEIGMYYLIARYYNPDHGVFLSVDPDPGDADDPVTMNGYTYGDNNPVMNVDPDGHSPTLLINAGFALYDGYGAYKSGKNWKGVVAAGAIGFVGGSRIKAAKHAVYALKNSKGAIRYIGRTSDVTARKSAHKRGKHGDLQMTVVAKDLSYGQARGLEHRLYLKNGGKKKLRNEIRPIGMKNKKIKDYMKESRNAYNKLKKK